MLVWKQICAGALALAVSLPSVGWAQEKVGAEVSVETRLKTLETQLGEVKTQRKSLSDELEALKAELASLKSQVTLDSPLKDKIEALDARIAALEPDEEEEPEDDEAMEGDDDGIIGDAVRGETTGRKFPFELEFSGFIRVFHTTILEGDGNQGLEYLGRNDGFGIDTARLTVEGTAKDVLVRLQFDGATLLFDETSAPEGDVRTAARDAFIEYRPLPEARLRVGRYRPPVAGEQYISSAAQLFVERSVAVRGVQNVEGRNVPGLGAPRQYGAMLLGSTVFGSEEEFKEGFDQFGVAWYASMTNGNSADEPLNDNSDYLLAARAEAFYGTSERDKVRFGLGAFTNTVTRDPNELPDVIDEEQTGFSADLVVDWYNVQLQGQFMTVSRSFPDVPSEPEASALGYHLALGYRIEMIGVTPVYRYAYYDWTDSVEADDPVTQAQLDADELTYHTIGLNWHVPGEPLLFQVNYTITVEDDQQAIDNDRLQFLGQVAF